MNKLSVYVIAYNEQDKIRQALASVSWADEIVLIDSGSTDETTAIAHSFGARVVQVPFEGFGRLRNSAIDACSHEWIFSLDADERCTPEVRDEIRAIIDGTDPDPAYQVPRRNYFMGRWIGHSGWYPDYRQPQLFRKTALRYKDDPVHEGYLLDGRLGRLKNAIWQFPFKDLSQVIAKSNRYSSLGAGRMAARNVSSSMSQACWHGLWAFLRHYLLRAGFLDGWGGFVIALSTAEGTFYRYAKRCAEQHGWDHAPATDPDGRRVDP